MLTLTTQLPKGFAATPVQPTPANGSVQRRCRPLRMPPRTRTEVLHMLVGADSGRLPRLPRRRPIR